MTLKPSVVAVAGLFAGMLFATADPAPDAQAAPPDPPPADESVTQPRLGALMLAPDKLADENELFALIDNNADGKIGRDEFNLKRMDAFFIRDADADGKLSRREFPGISDSLFAETDKDGDDFVSGYEFNQADWLTFESFDLNKDRYIDAEEFAGHGNRLK